MAIVELNNFFYGFTSEFSLQSYLLSHWYDDESWKIWGRRHRAKISFSRTTMTVESDWSLIKRLYLLTFNWPRVDLLVHVIGTIVMVKFTHAYDAMVCGRKKPFWWKAFVIMWKNAHQRISGEIISRTIRTSSARVRRGYRASTLYVNTS